MASVNKVILVGNLGQDPELKYTPGGAAVVNISLATTDNWTDDHGQKHSETEWHRVVAWGKTAENAAKYLTKGKQIYVEGKLKTRSWDDKTSGKKCYATDVIASVVQFLGGSPQNGVPKEPSAAPTKEVNLDDIPF